MSFRQDFDIPRGLNYQNSGTMAFSPREMLKTQSQLKAEMESNPAHALFSAWPQMWKAQKALAGFLRARPQDLFLRANVTAAMNDFIMALQIPRGSEILISDLEYGAIVNICRLKAETDRLELRTFSPGKNWISSIEKALSPKTKLLMLSHVTTGSGWVLPIEEIAELCRQKNVIFAVDGAHGAGSCPLDFTRTKIDFYGSNLHKWMMGPKGTGFGWVAETVREQLKPLFGGWTSYDVMEHFQVFGDGDPWTSRWMICSTHNFSDFYAISPLIEYWNKKGPEQIFKAQRSRRDFLGKAICDATGWRGLSLELPEKERGPMLAFQIPPKLAQRGFELIFSLREEQGLQVSMTMIQGEWCLRVAPHIYNTEEELFHCADILKKL